MCVELADVVEVRGDLSDQQPRVGGVKLCRRSVLEALVVPKTGSKGATNQEPIINQSDCAEITAVHTVGTNAY